MMLTLTSPVETPLHRLPVGAKLAVLALTTLVLLPLTDLRVIALASAAVILAHMLLGLRFARHAASMLRPLWPFLVVLALWHGWTADYATGLGIALKMLTAVALANLVTMTSRLEDMIAFAERVAQPLSHVGVSPRLIAMSIALVIRFTPVLMDKASVLMQSWRARSPTRPSWRVVVPVTLMALDDAEHVAEALRARGGL